MYFLRFAYSYIFYIFIPVFILVFLYRLKFYKSPVYSYSLVNFLKNKKLAKKTYHKKIFFILRSLSLFVLIFLIARPQWVDSSSKVNVEGIDIVLTLDVSGSMQIFDDLRDRRQRIQVAKDEAVRFIEKRIDDPIGVVIFARDSISRCPLTLDKNILRQVVGELELGYINPDGTSLGTGLATAVNRLRKSKAKSKIIILLTDGEPTPEKVSPESAIDLAKQFGIKVYTIGIGNEKGGYIQHPFLGVHEVGISLNTQLLKKIANETGGMFFRASNPKQLREIYNKIDALEKTEYQTDIFHKFYEAFLSFIWVVLLLLGLELFLRLFIWRGV
jgi:Ca-activated chloride channel homolog